MKWKCRFLPWHHIDDTIARRLSEVSMYFCCTCGEEYAVNMEFGSILPWKLVKSLYERLEREHSA